MILIVNKWINIVINCSYILIHTRYLLNITAEYWWSLQKMNIIIFTIQTLLVIIFSYIPLSMIKTMKVFRFLRGVLKSNKDISLCTRSLLRKQLPCICAETLLKFVFWIDPIVTTWLPIKDISITALESP